VQLFFDKLSYLDDSLHRIRVRRKIVNEFTNGLNIKSVLDIGCGDGSLSLVLHNSVNQITFNDLSEKMLKVAENNSIKASKRVAFDFILGDIQSHDFKNQKFDLIICVGVLAHVSSPFDLLEKIKSLCSDGGYLIIETTYDPYPIGRILKNFLSFDSERKLDSNYASYSKNRIKESDLISFLSSKDITLINRANYSIPFPGLSKLPQWLRYYYTFLTWKIRLLSKYGSEFIGLFKLKE